MADPETTIPSQYVEGFRANLNLSPQQKTARLLDAVDSDMSYDTPGKMFNADDVGISDPVDVDTRVAKTPDAFTAMTRRVGFFKPFHDARWLDNVDKARELIDPTNTVMQSMMAGLARKRDDAIINAAFADARELEDGSSIVTWAAAGQVVAVNDQTYTHQDEVIPAGNADYGLSIGKLIHAGLLLDASEIEGDRFIAVSAKQRANLLQTTPATNQFYAEVKALVAGQINEFMGFKIIRTERLLKTGNNRRCPAWVKPALLYRARPITNARISIRTDYSDTPQAFYKGEQGATRRYDTGVVEVLCKES